MHMIQMKGSRSSRNSRSKKVGIGSREHDFDGDSMMTFRISAGVRTRNSVTVSHALVTNVGAVAFAVLSLTFRTFFEKKRR